MEYLGADSLIYEPSCSSSIIIAPIFSRGANTALRAPIAILASPERSRHHSSNFSPADSPLCSIAAAPPKRERSCDSICGVRDISGTRNIALLPRSISRAITLRYISVLPLPVTPWIKCTVLSELSISSSADCCAGVSIFFSLDEGSPPKGFLEILRLSKTIAPLVTSEFTAPLPNSSQSEV